MCLIEHLYHLATFLGQLILFVSKVFIKFEIARPFVILQKI